MRISVVQKINLLVLCTIISFGISLGFYLIRNQTRVMNLELDENAAILLNKLSDDSEYPVLVKDREKLAREVEKLFSQKDVVFCRIVDRDGTILYQKGSQKASPVREFSAPIATKKIAKDRAEELILGVRKENEEVIGKIYLSISLSRLNQKVSDMKRIIMTIVVTAIILASSASYLLFRRILGAPIAGLVKATERISRGDLNYKVPITTNDEFSVLGNSFNRMTESLFKAQEELVRKEKLATLGQLAGSVGHELRNPLGVINNAIYFLKTVMPEADETVKEYLNIIKNEVDNSQRIISDLLDFSRTKTPQSQPIAADELIKQSLGKCSIPENITVHIDISETLPRIKVDPFQMGQVFQNLIINAVQAMPNGGTLRASARQIADCGKNQFRNADCGLRNDEQPNDAVSPKSEIANPQSEIEISVTDTGEGISPENMEKLFQPLFTTKAKGIGLGLTVSKNLTEANGGNLEVESELGNGTTFKVTLPVEK